MYHIPITGRIGRFVKILQTEITEDDRINILENAVLYESMNSAMKSGWWKSAVEKMESSLSTEKAVQIMTKCGAKCCGQGQRATARRLYNESDSIQNFLNRISKHDVKDGDLTYILENDSTIIAEHHKCFCKQVAQIKEAFTTMTYCQCSVEFNKQFFSAAFGKPVHVELLQSIICGADSCKFKVTF
jgi:hypothetical protein